MKFYWYYFGHIIYRNPEPGYRLRYNVIGVGSADTLSGIKKLIREHRAKSK